MATRLVVLDPDAGIVELFRRVGQAFGCEVVTESAIGTDGGIRGDLAAIAPSAFESASARRAFIEASEPDSVLLLVERDEELSALADEERQRLAGFAVKPLGLELATAHIDVVRRRRDERLRRETTLERGVKMRQALASRILYLQETERHHLARELHDAIGQMLLVHKLDAEWLRTRATSVELQKAAGTLARGLEETLELVRSLARGLRPSALDDLGLEPALEMLAEDFARHARCRVRPELRLVGARVRPQVAITLYRIAQEALTNAVKHGRCRHIWITLARAGDGGVELRVEDDGESISIAQASSGGSLGLLGMHERAALHGGEVCVAPREGGGTSVIARIPTSLERASR